MLMEETFGNIKILVRKRRVPRTAFKKLKKPPPATSQIVNLSRGLLELLNSSGKSGREQTTNNR